MAGESITAEAAGGIGNLALYRMCAETPFHEDCKAISDKVLVIGRVYAASPARGMEADDQIGFIDSLAAHLHAYRDRLDPPLLGLQSRVFPECINEVIQLHKFVDEVIVRFSADWQTCRAQKRKVHARASFTSKYLHFHAPDAFPILDKYSELGVFTLQPKIRAPKLSRYERFCNAVASLTHERGFAAGSLRTLDTDLVARGRVESARLEAQRRQTKTNSAHG